MANTISDELNRLIQAKTDIRTALQEKCGLTIGDSSTLDEFPGLIQEMQTGGGSDTSTLIDLIEGDVSGEFVIPNGTTKIGQYGLAYLPITDVSIPSSITSIGKMGLANTSINNITIPNTVTSIDTYAFAYNNNLSSLTIPDSVKIIPEYLLRSSDNVRNITLPDNLDTIKTDAFNGLKNCSINIGNVSTLNDGILASCQNVNLTISCSSINKRILSTNGTLSNLNITNDVKYIGNGVFDQGKTFDYNKDIIIPNSVEYLGNQNFQNWRKIPKIVIGEKVSYIGGSCFTYLNNTNEIILLQKTVPQIFGNSLGNTNYTFPIYVPGESIELYRNAGGYWDTNSYTARIKPLAAMDYDSSTMTVTASGRDNVELYVDSSLIDSSVYTFTPGTEDSSHVITVKSVDPSLGVLDEVSQEILIEGEEIDYSTQYFGLTAVQDASVGLTSSKDGGVDIKYSSDGENWTQWDYTNETLNLPAGETLYFKGDNSTGLSSSTVKNTRFTFQGENIKAHGNIQSLISDDDYLNNNTILGDFCFKGLFSGCTSLTTAPELPATTLTKYCYNSMFSGCTSLTTAPELPATTLVTHCYDNMFSGCTSLVNAPELPATTLADYCYYEMFKNSTSLINAPELPATVLRSSCYFGMFNGCTSLTTAPELPATTIGYSSYEKMFLNCTSLNYIKAMFTKYMAYTKNWVSGVSSTGTFVMNAAAEWDPEEYRGVNGIPEGWTVEKVTA